MTVSNENQHDLVSLVKSKLDIVDLISKYVDLKRSSRTLKGLCPFYPENTPSFVVYPEEQTFKCYCGSCAGLSGGDIFTFLMRLENIGFKDALFKCAEISGVDINFQEKIKPQPKKDIDQALQAASNYFRNSLESRYGSQGIKYLEQRGIKNEQIEEFGLGLSLGGINTLVDHLKKVGVKGVAAVESGLVQKWPDGTWHDFFIERLTIEIKDEDNNLVGFGARSLDNKLPKYINTPQTSLFNKSNILFGLNSAKDYIEKECIIVEGYMDVFAAHSENFKNVVACMGTSVTKEQLELISKYTNKTILCLDSDIAGRRASVNNLIKLINSDINFTNLNLEIEIASITEGKDPDELIRNNPSDWKKVIESSVPLHTHLINNLELVFDLNDSLQKNQAANSVYKIVFENQNSHIQDEILNLLSKKLNLSRENLPKPENKNKNLKIPENKNNYTVNKNLVERHVLALVVQNEYLKNYIKEHPEEIFSEIKFRELFSKLKVEEISALENDELLNESINELKNISLPQSFEKDLISELNNCINRLYDLHLKRQKREQEKIFYDSDVDFNDETIKSVITDSLKTNKLIKRLQSEQNK
ncbi:MAG: DNA primase [Chloroflexota bacterium]|nr:DNA primase [Chloroflexota bacterium]|tara:strand:- start:638 stop:2404 length:1767 start_codon:yes stop_codon:yes gene_type:complete